MARFELNKEELNKLSNAQLKEMYNEKTTPTLHYVMGFLRRKNESDEKITKTEVKKSTKK